MGKEHCKKNTAIPRSDIMEFCGEIVDIFEDYATTAGIPITNPDVESELDEDMKSGEYETREEAREANGYALLYGEDYDAIADEIEWIFYQADDLDGNDAGWIPEITETMLNEVVKNTYDAFEAIVKRCGHTIPEDKKQMLVDEVKKTFAAWEFI